MNILILYKNATTHSTANLCKEAFIKLGHKVIYTHQNTSQKQIIGQCKKNNIDILFIIKAQYNLTDVYKYCKNNGIFIMMYVVDVFFAPFKRSDIAYNIGKYCNLITTTVPSEINKWKEIAGHNDVYYLNQGIAEDMRKQLVSSDSVFKYDMAFSGGTYTPYRKKLISIISNILGNKFIHIKNKRESSLDKVLQVTRTVIAPTHRNIPGAWSNRVYEMTGRGMYVIHQHSETLDKEFKHKENIMIYNADSVENDVNQIMSYVQMANNHNFFNTITNNAYEISNNYTYKVRMQTLLDLYEAIK